MTTTTIKTQEFIEINLNAPTTPEERRLNIAGNLTLVRGSKSVPYADEDDFGDETAIVARQQGLSQWAPAPKDSGKPYIRFYSVGPGTERIFCPMCKQTADAEVVQFANCTGNLSCLLSVLSCCFPIFWLSFAYCCLQSRYSTKRMFCNKCGGHLGYHVQPK